MPDTELITIGAFARACGLSASALRFYADAGVLTPAVVDEATGYRYYTPDQSDTARLIRHLRAVDMPLPAVAAVLAEPDPARAAALVDDHLAALDRHLSEVRAAATSARAALHPEPPGSPDEHDRDAPISTRHPAHDGRTEHHRASADHRRGVAASRSHEVNAHEDEAPAVDRGVRLSGPLLAAALDQVATATLTDPTMPVLDTILFEADPHGLILTATDRYRLATRTLRPQRLSVTPWSATIDAADLRTTAPWLRRQHCVTLHPTPAGIEFSTEPFAPTSPSVEREKKDLARASADPGRVAADSTPRLCRRSTEDFPDYRAMLAALPPVRTRVVLARTDLLDALETAGTPTISLRVRPPNAMTVLPCGTTSPEGARSPDVENSLPATVTGPPMTLHFTVTTLYPAVVGAVGPDVMLDLLAPDLPVRVRSADDGDLSTLTMPREPVPTQEPTR
ncbi:MerR family transcriptional regulator [Nocardia lasii]|uniref:MerR family transcriptional regulator n=1 Tax=Nocardia lasii TaxID=1616107 RepID=A0ABW1JU26_9NOCA